MPDSLSSPSLKSGNVLALLNTLYASGFAMASSSTPLLKGRTLHALYALSFIVYVTNCLCDWLHITLTIRGYVASFPLNTWIAVAFVATAVVGSMLTGLLLVLCIENAFAHRLDITPYRSGCALVLEAFIEWTQAFNNFRIAFLIMLLHDAPMTIFNFFFIAACRCPNPEIISWSLIISSMSSCVSLMWRIIVLYFSYRRMVFAKAPKKAISGVAVNPPASQHFRSAIDTSSASAGGRLNEYDETWPIRWARLKTIGPHLERIVEESILLPCSDDNNTNKSSQNIDLTIKRAPRKKRKRSDRDLADYIELATEWIALIWWALVSLVVYLAMFSVLCIPCFYHYTCRKNSFYHRHKFCRSFIRYTSQIFHYAVFIFSLIFSLALIFLNIALLSSVHGLGSNNVPPEIDRVCVTVLPGSRTIYASVLSASAFQSQAQLHASVSRKHQDDGSIVDITTECKPLWEDGGLGLGLAREQAGVWQMRTPVGPHMIAVATQVVFNHSIPQKPFLQLHFEHALFLRAGVIGRERYKCVRNNGWKLIPSVDQQSWPYFVACERSWEFVESRLISCNELFLRRPNRRRRRFLT